MSQILTTDPWPIVVVRLPRRVDLASLSEVFDGLDAVFCRRERFATMIDLSAVSHLPGAAERGVITRWQKRTEEQQRRFNLGSAMVVRSAAVRGALTALQWVFVPPVPLAYVASAVEAFDWCIGRAEAQAVPVPLASRGYRSILLRESG